MKHVRPIAWSIFLAIAAVLSIQWASLDALDSSPVFRVWLFAGIGAAMIGLVFLFPDLPSGKARNLILLSAVFLRILVFSAPVSDDVNRYLWEGRIVAAGENPFSAPADDPKWEAYRDARWEAMNHRDRPTAYPPGIQWIMAAAVSFFDHQIAFKIISVLADVLSLILIIALLSRDRLPLRWAGFYAFNPIILIAFAAEAHFDALMVVAILGAILAAKFKRLVCALLLLGIAVQIKFIALILLPFFLWTGSIRSSLRSSTFPLLAFFSIIILPVLPFAAHLPGWVIGTLSFANDSAFNGPLFSILTLIGLPLESLRPICYSTFALGFLALLYARSRSLSLTDSIHGCITLLLLCSPIVHFWYLAWILPLAALRPSFGWIVASITSAMYFLAWQTLATHGWWGFQPEVSLIIWIPAFLAFAAQHRLYPWQIFRKISCPQETPNPSIGIVIPILNSNQQSENLTAFLRASAPPGLPVITADASEVRGRGDQIAAGISRLETTWILIAHVDTVPPPDWYHTSLLAIQAHPNASMFVLGQRFDSHSPGTLFIEMLNEIRVTFGGVAFGDQTMLIRKSALDRCGGFPAQPLMEDVEVSLRLQTFGRVIYIGSEWQVASVKWKGSFLKRFLMVIRLVAIYQIARLHGKESAQRCARRLYSEYYG